MDWTKIKQDLQRKLDPKHIKPAPRGKFGDYVDIHHVISEANRIFGEDGWSYTITRLEKVSEGTFTIRKGNGETFEQTRVGYMATVLVTVDGVTREGAAVGNGSGKPENAADLHESAVKEAESDALKRALRTFGNTFGLALYDKDKADVGVDAPPMTDAEKAERRAAAARQIAESIMNAAGDQAARAQWDGRADVIDKLRNGDPAAYAIIEEAARARGIISEGVAA